MTEIEHITARAAATRYAELLTLASGADGKISALEERVKEAEYFRLLAEYQLEAITWPEGLGQVFHIGTDEPDEQTYALLDLYSGHVWQCEKRGEESYWYRAEKEGPTTRYEWPLEETSGPYIRLKDDWYVRTLVNDARNADEQKRIIERELRNKPGYQPEGSTTWTQIPVSQGAIGAYRNLQRRHDEWWAEAKALGRKVEQLESILDDVREHRDALLTEVGKAGAA